MISSVADCVIVVGPMGLGLNPAEAPPAAAPPPPPIGSLFSVFTFQVPLKSGFLSPCARAGRSATVARSAAAVRIRIDIRVLQIEGQNKIQIGRASCRER